MAYETNKWMNKCQELQAELKQLKGETPIPDAWWKDCPGLAQRTMERIIEKNDQLQAEIEKLKEFARKVIQDVCWDMYVLDAGDVQEFAEKLGLIKPTTVTEEDNYPDFEVGDIIYKFSEILKEGEGNEQQPRRRAEKS